MLNIGIEAVSVGKMIKLSRAAGGQARKPTEFWMIWPKHAETWTINLYGKEIFDDEKFPYGWVCLLEQLDVWRLLIVRPVP